MTETFLRYLKHEKRVSSHTLTSYQNDLTQFSAFLSAYELGLTPLQADAGMIRAWVMNLVESGLESTSINRKIACLRTFYKFLLRHDHLETDPTSRIRSLKVRKRLPAFVKENEMEHLFDEFATDGFEGLRDLLVLELLYSTGMRRSELISLRESDIDLAGRTMKVLGKRNKERIIPFPAGLVEIIRKYRQNKASHMRTPSHDYLLVTSKGEPCYPGMINRIVGKYLNVSTNADKKSPHVLRHTYATHLLNHGAEINAVKDLLGHSSLAATQVYTHNSMEKLKQAFDQAHPKA
jgi:integrase/recombinase XerC